MENPRFMILKDRQAACAGERPRLLELVRARQAEVCVLGLGYVGLPLAVSLAEAGFGVRGLDVAADKVAQLREGRSYILDVPDAAVARQQDEGRFRAETDP